MEDNYFDKVLRDQLESPQEYPFEEGAWLDLEQRLEEQKPNRKIGIWWAAAAGILLPIALTSAFFYSQLKSTKQELVILQEELDKIKNQSTETPPQLVETQGVTAEPNLQPKNPSNIRIRDLSMPFRKPTTYAAAATSPVLFDAKTSIGYSENIEFDKTPTLQQRTITTANVVQFIPASKVNAPKSYTNVEDYIYSSKQLDYNPRKTIAIREYFIPTGYEVGVSSSAAKTAQGLVTAYGITAEIEFLDNLALNVGAEFMNRYYQTNSLSTDFPLVRPVNSTDVLRQVEVREELIQIPVALKYVFGDDIDEGYFVKAGGIARRAWKNNYRYNFADNMALNDEGYSVQAPIQQVNEGFRFNTLTVGVGKGWAINDNINVGVELFANCDINRQESALETSNWMAGCNAMLSYNF